MKAVFLVHCKETIRHYDLPVPCSALAVRQCLNLDLLEHNFDGLVDSFIADNVGIDDHFLNLELAADLKKNLLALYAEQHLQAAGIGNNDQLTQNKTIRSDKIYWLDRAHNDTHENAFFDLMDQFVAFLNSSCYTGITNYEFHYALYEKGSFYKKHLDRFKTDTSRAFSMIMYLNSDWKPADGGELCIYHANSQQTIAPENGKCVFFRSNELEHEVLVTQEIRMSITGWLKTN